MKITATKIPDLLIIEPKVFRDERGFFMESFNQASFNESVGKEVLFVQDNHSKSSKGVLRGMHYQLEPAAQGKLVRCTSGAVFDVAVDIRPQSKNYGEWVGLILSEENNLQFWIPEGFAHGFLVLTETAEFMYKTTNYYNPLFERGFAWNDSHVDIDWPEVENIVLSDKDKLQPVFDKK
ncbi:MULTISPECIES: dTDP-4-dehydrorhamnose 3,5-epimerase [Lelliottia]|jgi:dTDP-4-dehydrorhamnose 3,5-epimerase|uniref:dTDP-4-dehydrorhamnose 3,5-epimerase n=1 Tax=Lelliottia aquatilis TaxID=2080838 RepID=A0ABX4ZZF3_9ENTR|nr:MULTISPECIES: dTDP-4-dehydrorhamnose 3,5-epimerase [Lelliottia]MBL5882994.1 dTDP-4-dehydrorhamnose 3,5-epimerase [Lelliottia aquatilis]NTZ44562.1 dTDP-4-dehydrorhamnose 3,5-epimerase [Lelliottia aquatilis]POZ18313.1 dTDP-4-dehydrorhamnose 3,5-epimerase [Lelliottia sp. 7254-16]POZ21752.1 dTDP-4-dehydrorhamnose 3,5-epimerase [Lelliottia aquatilis]POZ23884.1 dTDP-4-dehydrorhamnose 3,5-epimerase [Lelliottia aquatilis]